MSQEAVVRNPLTEGKCYHKPQKIGRDEREGRGGGREGKCVYAQGGKCSTKER